MPSYMSYKNNVKVVMDADDDNIESWITVRGNHIPIMKGQSKEEAVKSFLEHQAGKNDVPQGTKWTPTNKKGEGTGKKEKYPHEFEVVRKNALANSNVYEGRYTQKSKAKAYEEYKKDTEKYNIQHGAKISDIESYINQYADNKAYKTWKEEEDFIAEKMKQEGVYAYGSQIKEAMKNVYGDAYTKERKEEAMGNKDSIRKQITMLRNQMEEIANKKNPTSEELEQYRRLSSQADDLYDDLFYDEPQTAEQANLWITETLASTEGFTSANFSKKDKERLKRIEAKFGDELNKMAEENALYEQAWQNVEEQERIANLAPGGPDGVFYTDFLSPSEMAEYEKEKEQKVKAEFERLKAEKEKSEKFDYGPGWPKSPKFEKLTKQYMPATGESDNELGEMLRSINRAAYRYYNDGDVWNKGYGKETVNAAVKHLTELAKNKNIPRHISRGLENGLYELKNAGKDKDKYETGLKLLLQTVEFAPEADINAMLEMKRNNGN